MVRPAATLCARHGRDGPHTGHTTRTASGFAGEPNAHRLWTAQPTRGASVELSESAGCPAAGGRFRALENGGSGREYRERTGSGWQRSEGATRMNRVDPWIADRRTGGGRKGAVSFGG